MKEKETTAHQLLRHVWENCSRDSWGRINHAMRQALKLAIGARLEFVEADFKAIFSSPRSGGFNGGYWVTGGSEWIYAMAIESDNSTAWTAYEAYKGRRPFIANNVEARNHGLGYIHADTMSRKRGRLAEGYSFPISTNLGTMTNLRRWYVTGFDDKAGIVRIALYQNDNHDGKPIKRRKLTHEDVAELCPAPKKPKKGKPEENQ